MSTTLRTRVLDALGPAFRERAGDQVDELVDGLITALVDVDALAQPAAGGWPTAFDLATTPQPAWLGQATGTSVPSGLPAEAQRALVRDRSGSRRGTPAALRAAVAAELVGTRRVTLLERWNGDPWALEVHTYAAETPSVDQVAVALGTQTPVGVRVHHQVLDGATYDHIAAEHGTYADVLADFTAYDAGVIDGSTLLNHVPEPGTEA
ncbi:hypothetical protein ACOACO_17395 [Nocardioides sp. CPCC 205120]|uniref:hypothetical protein n=1 Tax=Nocardioides sp. CPCC 205120 TaxID=3406462 RepID=UPI003B504555